MSPAPSGPVDMIELTDHLGLNHNAIRQLLAKLVEADLVTEETTPSNAAWPSCASSTRSRHAPRAVGRGRALRTTLIDVERGHSGAEDVARRSRNKELGNITLARRGRPPATRSPGRRREARHGFDSVVEERGLGLRRRVTRMSLFATTALAEPDTVCGLHLGIADGLAESLGGLVIDELIPQDPRRARCILRCSRRGGRLSHGSSQRARSRDRREYVG